jgi:hypothetical protein
VDDIKKIISKWNCAEADLISALVNASRKDDVDVNFTTQRVINFVPKDIREVATNYEIPYCTIRDRRRPSPDGMGYPVEIEVFNVSANDVFIGFGCWNGMYPDGKIIHPTEKMLNAYSSLEKVTNLKGDGDKINIHDSNIFKQIGKRPKPELPKEPYNGYNNEMAVVKELELYSGTCKHLGPQTRGEHHETDIIYNQGGVQYYIDVVACYLAPTRNYYLLATTQKDFSAYPKDTKFIKRMLAFTYKRKIRYLSYQFLRGRTGNISLKEELRKNMEIARNIFQILN